MQRNFEKKLTAIVKIIFYFQWKGALCKGILSLLSRKLTKQMKTDL